MIFFTHIFIIFLLIAPSGIQSGESNKNIMTLLKERETQGRISKRTFKNCIAAVQYPEALNALRRAESSHDFLRCISDELCPTQDDSYHDNNFMYLVPRALEDKDQEFKNYILKNILMRMQLPGAQEDGPSKGRADCRFMIVALLQAGADVTLSSPGQGLQCFENAMAFIDEDYNFAQEILARGADANAKITFMEPNRRNTFYKKYESTWTPLCTVKNRRLAELLVQYGARITEISRATGKTFLHQALEEGYEAELLKFYILKGIDANARCNQGFNALDHLVRYFNHCRSNFCDLEKKATILLDADSESTQALEFIRKNQEGDREITQLGDIIHKYQFYRQEAARLRAISI